MNVRPWEIMTVIAMPRVITRLVRLNVLATLDLPEMELIATVSVQ